MLVKSEMKAILILLAFSMLLREFISLPTIVCVFLGTLAVLKNYRPRKLLRNIFALLIFASYWFTYGKVIDPEVGLNFLVTVIILKILEKESLRDSYMIFFGLILVISAGSLFEKSITYVLFFIVSFFVLIVDFYRNINFTLRLKDFWLTLLWVMPLTLFLFFFVPRTSNPIPFQNGQPGPGEIGYTTNVIISEVESLGGNDRPVFESQVSRIPMQSDLYWRGNVLFSTDGWNWTHFGNDPQEYSKRDFTLSSSTDVLQKIRTLSKEDYFFALDAPTQMRVAAQLFEINGLHSKPQRRWQWIQNYEVISTLTGSVEDHIQVKKRYLAVPLPKDQKQWIEEHFKGKNLAEVSIEISRVFGRQNFVYSLSPGKISSFKEFMSEKKIGFCSHYSSALALILRQKGIPSRLVSGFMGGNYNPYSQTYLVTQNDAHVWVEAFDGERWKRIDPTAWIAPSRVQLGGEAFMASRNETAISKLNPLKHFKFLKDAQMWFAQWDFRFYQWLEEMDYYGQESFFTRIQFKRQWAYGLLPLLVLIFVGLYALKMMRAQSRVIRDVYEEFWELFAKKLKRRNIQVSLQSSKALLEDLERSKNPEKAKFLRVARKLLRFSFSSGRYEDGEELKKEIKKL
jgi:protein-glutamine gamma-glutamyltransferase